MGSCLVFMDSFTSWKIGTHAWFSKLQQYLLDNKIDSALWLTRVFTIISAILYLLPFFRYVLSYLS